MADLRSIPRSQPLRVDRGQSGAPADCKRKPSLSEKMRDGRITNVRLVIKRTATSGKLCLARLGYESGSYVRPHFQLGGVHRRSWARRLPGFVCVFRRQKYQSASTLVAQN
jgi:hypothetical protein